MGVYIYIYIYMRVYVSLCLAGGLIKVEGTSVSLRQINQCIGRSLAGIAGSNPGRGKDLCIWWVCVLSGRVFCVGLITRPEESYRMWCVSVWP